MEYSGSLVPLVLILEEGNPIGLANFLKLGFFSWMLLASPARSGACPSSRKLRLEGRGGYQQQGCGGGVDVSRRWCGKAGSPRHV